MLFKLQIVQVIKNPTWTNRIVDGASTQTPPGITTDDDQADFHYLAYSRLKMRKLRA
jgi:hypothetical protein